MIKDRESIIKKGVDEKTCASCINQIDGYCCYYDLDITPMLVISGCGDYIHYNELREVK